MISVSDMTALEDAAENAGLSKETLMENAGQGLAEAILKHYQPKHVLICCGSGHNAGDGFVAARYLKAAGIQVSVYMMAPAQKLVPLSRQNYEKLEATDMVSAWPADVDCILDCLLGTGVQGQLYPAYREIISKMNMSDCTVVSCDVPSGQNADTGEVLDIAVKADMLVSMHALKQGLMPEGIHEIVDIGLPKSLSS